MSIFHSTVEYRNLRGSEDYRVGTDGSIWTRNTAFHRKNVDADTDGEWRKMKVHYARNRQKVLIRYLGKRKCFFVHRLILETFIGPCPDGMECCHNDGNPQNNQLCNLRWDTHRNNIRDKASHGTLPLGETHHMAKLTADDVRQIRMMAGTMPQTELAKKFNVSQRHLSKIIRGKAWYCVETPDNEYIAKRKVINANPIRPIILKALASGPLKREEVVARTGINKSAVANCLARMKEKGMVDQPKYGVWMLKS